LLSVAVGFGNRIHAKPTTVQNIVSGALGLRLRLITGERLKTMRGTHKFQHLLIWFERGGWWFKVFSECFGPYPDPVEARYHLLVIQGLSRQLREVLSKQA
jgi:hypothetical protein